MTTPPIPQDPHAAQDALTAAEEAPPTLTPPQARVRRAKRTKMIADLQASGKLPPFAALPPHILAGARPAPGQRRFAHSDVRRIPVTFASSRAETGVVARGHYEARKLPAALSEHFGCCPHVVGVTLDLVPKTAYCDVPPEELAEHQAIVTRLPHILVAEATPEDGPYLLDVLIQTDGASGYPHHRFLLPSHDLYLLDPLTREPVIRADAVAEELYRLYPHKHPHLHRHPKHGPPPAGALIERSGHRAETPDPAEELETGIPDHLLPPLDGRPATVTDTPAPASAPAPRTRRRKKNTP